MNQSIALMITSSPFVAQTYTAFQYVVAAKALGKDIIGLFFYQDGTTNANTLNKISADELNMLPHWQYLTETWEIPLHICISAGERRGVVDDLDGDTINTVASIFTVSGLGEMVSLSQQADVMVQF